MDGDQVREILTDEAIGLYRVIERTRFLLDRREAALAVLLTRRIDLARYYLETETIRAEFDAKRDKWQAEQEREAARR
jgi:hypothetical protein